MDALSERKPLHEMCPDTVVSSIVEHRRNFLNRMELWRKSRSGCMNRHHIDEKSPSNQVHVLRCIDSYSQTSPICDRTETFHSQNNHPSPRLSSACPIISSYLMS